MAGGYTLSMPEQDIHYKTLGKFQDELAMAMGGLVAEETVYGHENMTTGPASDLKQATHMATAMIMRHGMSEKLGPRQYGDNEELIFLAQEIHAKKNYSEKTAELIDEEIDRVLSTAKKRAEKIFHDHRKEVDALVSVLLEKETVEQEEFLVVMGTPGAQKEEKIKEETVTGTITV